MMRMVKPMQPILRPAGTGGARRVPLMLLLLALTVVCLPGAPDVHAGPLRLDSQLIWGTDGEKPPGAKCKELEPALKRRLSRVFKWKNYYEIRRKEVEVSDSGVEKVRMSEKCLLEISLPEADTIEVKLIGEGKLTKTTRQSTRALRGGELLVLAGDAKDNSEDAWFVVLSVPRKKAGDDAAKPPGKTE